MPPPPPPLLLLLLLLGALGPAAAANKKYGIDTGMKLYGNQGKEEDEPKVREAAKQIRCDVCTTLVVDIWNKTVGFGASLKIGCRRTARGRLAKKLSTRLAKRTLAGRHG
eukprot:SAG31_NODE_11377_length_1037_cov_1.182303_2_plen_110_part_00